MKSKMWRQTKHAVLSCRYCGREIERKRNAAGRLEDFCRFSKRKYCSTECRDKAQMKPDTEIKRCEAHLRARKFRKECCELCASMTNLQVHHKDKNEWNNSPENLQTLCASCHNHLHWLERPGRSSSGER